jgi:hypothetical protein
MKTGGFTIALLAMASLVKAQSSVPVDSLYAVTYATGPAWDAAKQPNDQVYFKEHSANLAAWRSKGIIKLGARYANKGMIVIAAQSLQAAKHLVFTEVSVANQLFVAEVQAFTVFYYGCLEKQPAGK